MSQGRRSPASRRAHLRLLLIRPDHIGDVILTSPAVELLRIAIPEAHLTMMVGPWSEEIARRDPMLDEVLSFPFPGFTRAAKTSIVAPYQVLWAVSGILRRGEYDAAVIMRDDHWWGALAATLAGIRVRVGCGISECRPFLTHALPPANGLHWTKRALRLASLTAETLGGGSAEHQGHVPLRFGARTEDESEISSLWGDLGLEGATPTVVMHPGSGADLKLWPEENWVETGRRLAANGAAILLTGSKSEAGMVGRIAMGIPGSKPLAGKVGLGTLAALFKRCSLAVGTDNGPMHMAVAMDAPSVCLYGPTDPAVYGPWGDCERHLSLSARGYSPCGRLDLTPIDGVSPACMRAISVDEVVTACLRLLNKVY